MEKKIKIDTYIRWLKTLITNGQVETALKELVFLMEDNMPASEARSKQVSKIHDEVVSLSSIYQDLKQQTNSGTIDPTYAERERNRLVKSILETIKTVKSNLIEENIALPANEILTTAKMAETSVVTNDAKPEPDIIELTINKDFKSFSKTQQNNLLKAIKELLTLDKNLKIRTVQNG